MIQINKQSLCGSIASRIFQTNTVKPEAATRGFLLEKVVLEISQNSQENTCAIVSFLIKILLYSCFPVNFAKFLKQLFYRTPLVAASAYLIRTCNESYIPKANIYYTFVLLTQSYMCIYKIGSKVVLRLIDTIHVLQEVAVEG